MKGTAKAGRMSGDVKARANELTSVSSRDIFESPPWTVKTDTDLKRWSAFRSSYHDAQGLKFSGPFPLQVDFELSSSCQLRCAFCLHGMERVPRRDLDRGLLYRILDECGEHGLVSIKLNYINEPLLAPDLEDVIRYARSRGVLNTYFATNGAALTEERSRALIDAGVSKIMVSLDATTSETFMAARRSRAFDVIEANIHRFLRVRDEMTPGSGPRLRVNFLRTSINAHEADEFMHRWSAVADAVGYQQQVALPGIDSEQLGRVDEEFGCSFPFKQLVVESRGMILPCCTFSGREMPIGSANSMTLAEAWRSAAAQELRALHARRGYRENPNCLHCINGCKA